ncbi:MAG: hypothetical protein COB22_08080 [Cycloclasticus sp.]|nr:MAG: hypothetical protein COB22_08080 [Cycloclasticus sp.]
MTNIIFFKGYERPQLVAKIKAFRLKIWSESIGLDNAISRFGDVVDEHDLRAWHLVKYDKKNIIACVAFNIAQGEGELADFSSYEDHSTRMRFPLAVVNRMVIDSQHTRKGIREEFYLLYIQKARELEILELWGEVEKHRMKFNLRNNYVDVGVSSDKSIAGDWRILMKKLDV